MERLLVALDGSAHSDKALELAADLAETYGAELLLAHVMSSAPLSVAEREMAAAEYGDELASWTTTRTTVGSGEAEGGAQELLLYYSDLTHHFRETMGKHLLGLARRKLAGRKIDQIQVLLADGDPAGAGDCLCPSRHTLGGQGSGYSAGSRKTPGARLKRRPPNSRLL